jgi:PAS domain S-box-containing protein
MPESPETLPKQVETLRRRMTELEHAAASSPEALALLRADLESFATSLDQEITERKRLEEALRRSEGRKTAILETALDAVISIDHEGKVIEWNAAAARIFGFAPSAAIGQSLAELIVPPALRQSHGRGLARFLQTGEGPVIGHRLELPACRADGTQFPAELAITVTATEGRPIFTAYVRDITARKRLEAELRQRAEELVRSDRAKDEFLAMLAHELRNPIGAISNAIQFMERVSPPEPRLARACQIIQRQVTHQAHLVDDLLDVSRIARGKIVLRPQRLELLHLLRGTAEDYRSLLEAAGLSLELTLPSGPLWIEADPTRLAQAISNLLDNAAKFTDPGGQVTVAVTEPPHASPTDGQEGQRSSLVEIRVADTGIGIEPALLPQVFQAFAQADRSLDRSRGGLGLGLALVKGLIELHGGEVSVASGGIGQGTEFALRLPLAAPLNASPEPPSVTDLSRKPLRILLVEDNPDVAATQRDLLLLLGDTVRLAATGPEALAVAREFRPEVVLCDLGLPGMDGYEVVAALRRDPATASAHLIALSGYGQEEDLRRSREAGFDLHLTKPLDFTELQHILAGLGSAKQGSSSPLP